MAQTAQSTPNPAPKKLPFWLMNGSATTQLSSAEIAAHNAAVRQERTHNN
ncbi:MAG: hypothetical protein VX730_02320 [Pseudomonadota bacterium]|nr:hypothetical protein [Pseudomonadota bacterium]